VILGPTCSGKTGRAVQLAKKSGAPVIAVDRIQVYEDLAITSGRPSDDELGGTARTYLDHRLTTSSPVEMTAAEGLRRLRRLIAQAPSGAILEGGSISLWETFFAERDAQGNVSTIIVRRIADWQRFARRVEQRILGLLGSPSRSMLDELGATLTDHRSRRLVLGTVGIRQLQEWTERRHIAPEALSDVKHDLEMCQSLAAHMTPAWVYHARMQQATFERLLAAHDHAVELVEDLDAVSSSEGAR
jgi:tRNA A37 N6-isopentenylltransferase MiaA